jgi:hypothetical protein
VVGRIDPGRGALIDFVSRGGRILVLRQEAYPEGIFDLQPTPQKSTMTFPTRPGHPVLEGLEADDLKFWRGDHMVADHELPRPSIGATVPIVVSGSDTGIAYAPLLERPLGQGSLVHCQLKLVQKAEAEPAAGLILSNLLEYLSQYKPRQRKTAVLGADEAYRDSLLTLGLRFDELAAGDDVDLSAYSSVICRGQVAGSKQLAEQLGPFVKQGGNLLVHRPSPSTMEIVRQAVGSNLVAQPFQGSVTRADGNDPLLEVLTREDLYWSMKRPGLSWARQPLSTDMIDGVFGLEVDRVLVDRDRHADDTVFLTAPPAVVVERRGTGKVIFDRIRWDTEEANGRKAARHACSLLTALEADFMPRSATTLECEQMTPNADMPHYNSDGSAAYMGSNGYIKSTVQVAQSRLYAAELVASGDDSEGICPLVEVRLDGKKVAEVQLTTEGWRSYRFDVELPEGEHELSLWFVNDHYSPSGDRNLRLDKLLVYNNSK